jgi:U3 small nucleolar RNA-associated protein 14
MPFSLSHAHKSRISRDVNLDEDEAVEDDDSEIEDDAREGSEEDDDLGEEGGPAITLSTMLDVHPDEMDSRSDSQSKSGSEDDSVEVLAVSDTEDAFDGEVDALANLDSFIDGLSTSHKRKATDTGDHNPTSAYNRPRKKRIIPEQTQAGAESEFAVSGGAKGLFFSPLTCGTQLKYFPHADAERITIEDLLKPLSSVKTHGTVTSLEKTAKLLLSSKAKPLAAPLHTRQQERLDREAAYDATKEEVEKWAPTMKRIKQVRGSAMIVYT